MSKVSEHLAKFHQAASAHHRAMAKCHKTAIGKAVDGNPEHQFHKTAAEAHDQAADSHDQMCQACQKAIEDSLNKVQPTLVSAVAPDNPNYRAVPRAGQRPVAERPNVDDEFVKALGLSEEFMHVEEKSLLK